MGAVKPVSLALEGLGFTFPGADEPVLRDIHLKMDAGGFLVLVGESGCGKSTLLRLLAGLEKPTNGSILFDGVEVNELEPRERDVAMVFQSYALYPHMTVAENLGFPLRVAKQSPESVRSRVGEVAEALGLSALLQRKPGELSGGQRQRVAMGRAMVRQPRLFLFDEPLSNLDANLRAQMRAELGQRHRELGITTVYVTHDQVEAMTLADSIALLRNGRLEQVGSPEDCFMRPETDYVASFFGQPPAAVVPGAWSDGILQLGQGQVPFKADWSQGQDSQLKVGLRPDTLVLDTEGALEGHLDEVEYTGAECRAYFRLRGLEDHRVCVSIDSNEAAKLAVGTTARLGVLNDRILLFGADGKALRVTPE